jgi:hypothetical protein
MNKTDNEEQPWETASLEWIHRVRREMQAARQGRPAEPLLRQKAEELAKRYGLRLAARARVRDASHEGE